MTSKLGLQLRQLNNNFNNQIAVVILIKQHSQGPPAYTSQTPENCSVNKSNCIQNFLCNIYIFLLFYFFFFNDGEEIN